MTPEEFLDRLYNWESSSGAGVDFVFRTMEDALNGKVWQHFDSVCRYLGGASPIPYMATEPDFDFIDKVFNTVDTKKVNATFLCSLATITLCIRNRESRVGFVKRAAKHTDPLILKGLM